MMISYVKLANSLPVISTNCHLPSSQTSTQQSAATQKAAIELLRQELSSTTEKLRRSEEEVDNSKRDRERTDFEAKEHKEAIERLAAKITELEKEAKQVERNAAQKVKCALLFDSTLSYFGCLPLRQPLFPCHLRSHPPAPLPAPLPSLIILRKANPKRGSLAWKKT